MSGRAGRRGKDDKGIVIQILDEQMEPDVAKNMIYGASDPLFRYPIPPSSPPLSLSLSSPQRITYIRSVASYENFISFLTIFFSFFLLFFFSFFNFVLIVFNFLIYDFIVPKRCQVIMT